MTRRRASRIQLRVALVSLALLFTSLVPSFSASANAELSTFQANVGFFFPIPLTPGFASGTTNYSATVVNRDETIAVRAIALSSEATMQWRFNGGAPQPLLSNAFSRVAALLVGTNRVEIEVTAGDAVTKKSYFLTVTRAAAPPEAVTMDAAPADGDAVTLVATAFLVFGLSAWH